MSVAERGWFLGGRVGNEGDEGVGYAAVTSMGSGIDGSSRASVVPSV